MKSHRSLRRRSMLCLLAAILIITSCTKIKPSAPTQRIPLSPVKAEPSAIPTSIPVRSATPSPLPVDLTDPADTGGQIPVPERAQYRLAARLNASTYTIQVSENITYPNRTGETLHELVLGVDANRFSNAFHLEKLFLNGADEAGAYRLEGTILRIPLRSPLAPQQVLRLSQEYNLILPEIPPPSDTNRPVPFGYTGRQVNIVDWYPYIPAYRPGEGWLIHQPWYFGEHQAYDVADF
ncbi:MAG: hypothetical protein ACM3PY_04595, partial [Omnitrophica WOR_2 bacterium]